MKKKLLHALNEKKRRSSRTEDEIKADSEEAKQRWANRNEEQRLSQSERERLRRSSRTMEEKIIDSTKSKQRWKKYSTENLKFHADKEKRRRKNIDPSEKRQSKLREAAKSFVENPSTGYWDFGAPTIKCSECKALRYLGERLKSSSVSTPKFGNCCSNGKISKASDYIFKPPPPILKELLESESSRAAHFRKHVREYNNALSMASINANFVNRGLGSSKWNPTITIQGRLYHEIGALFPELDKKPRYCAVYIHDTDYKEQAKCYTSFS